MKKRNNTKEIMRATLLRRLSAALVVCAIFLLVLNTTLYIRSNSTVLRRFQSTYQETQEQKGESADASNRQTERELAQMMSSYNVVNVVTCMLVALLIVMQFIQKKILYKVASTDPMTGGINYQTFRERMESGIHIRQKAYIIAADLKDFSLINDSCGVEKGDEMIRELSKVFDSCIFRINGEMSAHIVGDRFALFLQCPNDEVLIARLSRMRSRILEFSEKFDVPYLMPVFGICEITKTTDSEKNYGSASFANGRLKNTNKNKYYEFFDQEMSQSVLEDRRMEENFEFAIAKKQFEVWYQPKYNTDSDRLAAAEALVRWRLEDGKMLSPGAFIPLFESNGMIAQLDEYVFDRVCAKQRSWMDEGREILPISVNISRGTFLRPDIADRYVKILNSYEIPASCVELELTESALSRTNNTGEILQKFRDAGLKIWIDDFGVGYSSLSTLVARSFDGIKLDKSLVDKIASPSGVRLAEVITDLAHEFNMYVTAEGVETEEQVAMVKKLACNMIQGYFYSKPLPEQAFEELLSKAS